MKRLHQILRIALVTSIALANVPRVLAQKPDVSQAIALERQGRTSEAAVAWKAVIMADPSNAEALAHLGLLEARQDQYADAIDHYKKALALKPDFPGLQLNLGLALFKAARFPEAIPAFTSELHKHPGDQRLTILLAMSHYGMGDYLVAVPYLQRAAANDTQNLELRMTLAHSCMWSKQYQCVLDVEKEILTLNPDSAEADILAGEALDEQGDDVGAIEQFRAATKANPKEPNVHFGLGYLLWKQSKFAEAAVEFQAEIDNDPSNVGARSYLGDSYVELTQFDKAKPELTKALAANPDIEMAHRDLGIVYASTDRNDDAIRELKRAVELDSQDIAPHWRLAKLYQVMGKKDEAKAEFAISSKMHQQANEALTAKMSGPPPTQP